VGALREDFVIGHEDREYALRLDGAGWLVIKDKSARVTHENKAARRRSRPSVVRGYYGNRNEAYLLVHVRHDRWSRVQVLGRTVVGVVRAVVRERPRLARARARIRASIDGLRGDLGPKAYSYLKANR
jgi:GT2 family glycosyltransferase